MSTQAYPRGVQRNPPLALVRRRPLAVKGLGIETWAPFAASVAAAGYPLAMPFAILGVFAFPSAPSRLASRGESVLAGSIVALSLLFIAWVFGLGKVYEASASSPEALLIALAYPLGDIITATVLIVALGRARHGEVGRMLLLLGGLASNALADSAFAFLTANGTYGAQGSGVDAGS